MQVIHLETDIGINGILPPVPSSNVKKIGVKGQAVDHKAERAATVDLGSSSLPHVQAAQVNPGERTGGKGTACMQRQPRMQGKTLAEKRFIGLGKMVIRSPCIEIAELSHAGII